VNSVCNPITEWLFVIIRQLRLNNFRCFANTEFSFDKKFIIIQGPNGSGKSSILEALHYSCYLRSFRTHLHKELMLLGENHFFAHILFDQELTGTNDQIQIGYSSKQGKVVKLNQKPVQSYKELLTAYRIVTLTADDLSLIHSAPEARRSFMNYSLFLIDPECAGQLKRYKQIVDQRNKLLSFHGLRQSPSFHDELKVWTGKMWEESQLIRASRKDYLAKLEAKVNILLQQFFWSSTDAQLHVKLEYVARPAVRHETFDSFWKDFSQQGLARELQYGRSTFGAHLDDMTIIFQQKKFSYFCFTRTTKIISFFAENCTASAYQYFRRSKRSFT
jgi:DNA replication and repair protein RecF